MKTKGELISKWQTEIRNMKMQQQQRKDGAWTAILVMSATPPLATMLFLLVGYFVATSLSIQHTEVMYKQSLTKLQ